MRKLFLCGPQRSGKSTIADYLHERYGATDYPLSAPLKHIATTYYGMHGKDRRLLIQLATAMRSVDPLVFCKNALSSIVLERPDFAVISDVRQMDEVAFFLQCGFKPLRIHAPLEVRAQRQGFDPEFVAHPTEQPLPVDPVIVNAGSLEELHHSVDSFMRNWI